MNPYDAINEEYTLQKNVTNQKKGQIRANIITFTSVYFINWFLGKNILAGSK